MILVLVLFEVITISAQSLDDQVFLVGLHTIGGSDPLVAGALDVLLSSIALHPN